MYIYPIYAYANYISHFSIQQIFSLVMLINCYVLAMCVWKNYENESEKTFDCFFSMLLSLSPQRSLNRGQYLCSWPFHCKHTKNCSWVDDLLLLCILYYIAYIIHIHVICDTLPCRIAQNHFIGVATAMCLCTDWSERSEGMQIWIYSVRLTWFS